MMAVMEPLLYAAKVDLVFAGHVHAYERTVSIYSLLDDPYIQISSFFMYIFLSCDSFV